jgi:hypothetical protein
MPGLWTLRLTRFAALTQKGSKIDGRSRNVKTLVAGWFSFINGHATAGDLLSRDLVCEWLQEACVDYDVAVARPFVDGVGLQAVDPAHYSHLIIVCGPFLQGELEAILVRRFSHCRLIGLNLSMEISLDQWNPFDYLIERDSSRKVNPDLVFLSRQPPVPVVGICLVEDHAGAMTTAANEAISRLKSRREAAFVPIDTRLDENGTGLRTPREIESLLARMDLVITTRLHGTVLSLKNGVPVIAIDPIPGGAKIRRQAERIGWPLVFCADNLSDDELQRAFDSALTEDARHRARKCTQNAIADLECLRREFIQTLTKPGSLDGAFQARISTPQDVQWMERFQAPPQTVKRDKPRRLSLKRRFARIILGNRE